MERGCNAVVSEGERGRVGGRMSVICPYVFDIHGEAQVTNQ